jgi:hypothetical protein
MSSGGEYGGVFRDLHYEVFKVAFLNAFLNGAIVFFIGNVLATILRFSFWYSLVPAGIVFLLNIFLTMRRYTLRRIEEGNPEVSEILRTAHDNQSHDGILVQALFVELFEKMETVSAGVFIDAGKTVFKLLGIAALAFTPLLVANYAPFLILDEPLSQLGILNAQQNARDALAPVLPIGDAGDRDLSGQKDVIDLGNERLDITTAASQGGVDFSNTGDANGREFTYNDYPEDVSAEQTRAGTGGGGDASERDLINDYSCKTKGTC